MPSGETIAGVPSRVIPTKAIFDAAREVVDRVRREDGLAAILVGDVGGEEREVGAVVRVAVAAAIDRMAAVGSGRDVVADRPVAVGDAQQLVDALVELVVADAVVVEAHDVEGLDRRLVVEQRRQQRRRADQVTGRHEDRVRVGRLEVRDVGGEVLGATGRHAGRGQALEVRDRADRGRYR